MRKESQKRRDKERETEWEGVEDDTLMYLTMNHSHEQ